MSARICYQAGSEAGATGAEDILGPAGAELESTAQPDVPRHALETYSPKPKHDRRGLALCLSGGGFRAALFHLGALRRLNELGVLSKFDTITSVSGGTIVAAHLATSVADWPPPGDRVSGWEAGVAEPLRAFTKRNLRAWPLLNRLLPWNWLRSSTAAETIAVSYQKRLTPRRLTELPLRPRFVLCATDMAFGVNWVFDSGMFQADRGRVGDYQAGHLSPFPAWPLARAVAASSCFPPVFNPLPIRIPPGELRGGRYAKSDRDDLVRDIRLSDGGVYDNLGLEPVWKDHLALLVSDGGGVFEAERDTGLFWRLNRYVAVTGRQGGALRKRWLISNFLSGEMEGTYWGIGSPAVHYGTDLPGYSGELVDEVISEVRTDLDAFSRAEISVLENHGYLLADAAIRRHAPALVEPSSPPLSIPHPEWMDEGRVRTALAESHKVKVFGRW